MVPFGCILAFNSILKESSLIYCKPQWSSTQPPMIWHKRFKKVYSKCNHFDWYANWKYKNKSIKTSNSSNWLSDGLILKFILKIYVCFKRNWNRSLNIKINWNGFLLQSVIIIIIIVILMINHLTKKIGDRINSYNRCFSKCANKWLKKSVQKFEPLLFVIIIFSFL